MCDRNLVTVTVTAIAVVALAIIAAALYDDLKNDDAEVEFAKQGLHQTILDNRIIWVK
jgi:hypothetical protein